MRYANPTRGRFPFNRSRLPSPVQYYQSQDIKLQGGSEWKKARRPFHVDKNQASLYVWTRVVFDALLAAFRIVMFWRSTGHKYADHGHCHIQMWGVL
jgi:hypothetical protein